MDKVLLKYTEYNEPHESRTNGDIVDVSTHPVRLAFPKVFISDVEQERTEKLRITRARANWLWSDAKQISKNIKLRFRSTAEESIHARVNCQHGKLLNKWLNMSELLFLS